MSHVGPLCPVQGLKQSGPHGHLMHNKSTICCSNANQLVPRLRPTDLRVIPEICQYPNCFLSDNDLWLGWNPYFIKGEDQRGQDPVEDLCSSCHLGTTQR